LAERSGLRYGDPVVFDLQQIRIPSQKNVAPGTQSAGEMNGTRNGTCLIPTNWIEDVLKPAGSTAGIPNVSPHWFRRGHATVQHHGGVHDKPIQGQLRHANPELHVYMQQVDLETWKAVVDLEMLVSKNGDDTQSA
jgi:integrase